ncbi:MAG: hypothetical protein ACLFO1_06515 [Spirochaetaceae bacterium]
MRISLDLDIEQVKAILDQLSPEEQMELGRYLQRKGALDRLGDLHRSGQEAEISEEEIAAEVEAVRRERYERTKAT